jgi:hypothetical protein
MSGPASWLGGLMVAFGGFNLMHFLHINLIAVAAHLPWLMLAADRVLKGRATNERLAGAAGGALVLGSAFLMGYPQLVLLSAVAVSWYAIWQTVRAVAHEEQARPLVSAWAWLMASALAGAGLGAVQLLPTLDAAAASVRNAVPPAFSVSYSLHPFNLVQLLAPYAMRGLAFVRPGESAIHESAVYAGSFGSFAIAWAILRGRQMPHRPIVTWALWLCAGSLVLALGRYGGLYYLLAKLPVVGEFRAPGRFIFLVHFGVAIIGAAVFDDLATLARTRPPRPQRAIVGIAVLATLSTAIVGVGYLFTGRGVARGAVSVGLMLGTALLMILAATGRRAAIWLLPALVAFDLALWGYGYLWQAPLYPLQAIARMADVPPGHPGEMLSAPTSNLPVLRGYRVLNPYVSLTPVWVLDPQDPITRRLAGAAWQRDRQGWTRVTAPMPRARLVFDWLEFRQAPPDLRSIDFLRTALVEAPIPVDDRAARGTARVLEDKPGRIVIQVEASGRGLLVTTERYHQGWRAASDVGRPLAVVRINGDFLGCVVEPGVARVELTFAPRSLRTGAWISGATFLGVVILVISGVPRSRVHSPRSTRQ